jgi:hypothetical protein
MEKSINPFKLLLVALLIVFIYAGLLLSKKNTYEWVFVYYMSYDNDLSGFGETILRDLKKGITSPEIAVVTQADFADGKGMRRIALYRALGRIKRKEISLQNEDSADPAELEKYFKWIQEKWKAENYCVIFLNHGGTLNNMCRDEKPFQDQNENKLFASGKWLPATEVGKIVADFNRKVDGKVRLLFLQQCGRAAIQSLYNLIDTAEYIMASSVKVGAPNTYYTKLLKSVADEPDTTGTAIANIIMQEDEHYTIYTLIGNNELKNLPEKLSAVLESFLQNATLKPPQSCTAIFEFEGEKFFDLKSYLQALSSANNETAAKELRIFFDWCDNHLIVSQSLNNAGGPAETSHCGLSIYVPSNQKDVGRYNFLPLYQQTDIDKFFLLATQE